MIEEHEKFGFTDHALERGLERILNYEAPYTRKQMNNMKVLIVKSMQWHPFSKKWVLPDYEAELVIENGSVVTIILDSSKYRYHKPVSVFQQTHHKKFIKMGKMRNKKKKDR